MTTDRRTFDQSYCFLEQSIRFRFDLSNGISNFSQHFWIDICTSHCLSWTGHWLIVYHWLEIIHFLLQISENLSKYPIRSIRSEDTRMVKSTQNFELFVSCRCWHWSLDWCLEYELYHLEQLIHPYCFPKNKYCGQNISLQQWITCPVNCCCCWPPLDNPRRSTRPSNSATFWSMVCSAKRIWSWPSKIVRNSRSYSDSNWKIEQ